MKKISKAGFLLLAVIVLVGCGSKDALTDETKDTSIDLSEDITTGISVAEILEEDIKYKDIYFEYGSSGEYEGWNYGIRKSADGKKGYVTLYAVNVEGPKVVIPETIEGYPVMRIEESEIYGLSDEISEIEFPDTVCFIPQPIFHTTEWYKNQPDGEIYIGKVLYDYKGEVPEGTTINIKEGTVEIAKDVFEGCSGLKEVLIPDSVLSIRAGAFERCTSLESVTMSKNVMVLHDQSFNDCYLLSELYLPKSIMKIVNPFSWKLEQLHYEGTEEDWNALISGDSYTLKNASPDLIVNFEK